MAVTGYLTGPDGQKRCPVDVCGAVCCRASHFRPDRKPPCEYLTDRLTCELHEAGGPSCKPVGCWTYPRSQADIDAINRLAEAAGFEERCQLKVI